MTKADSQQKRRERPTEKGWRIVGSLVVMCFFLWLWLWLLLLLFLSFWCSCVIFWCDSITYAPRGTFHRKWRGVMIFQAAESSNEFGSNHGGNMDFPPSGLPSGLVNLIWPQFLEIWLHWICELPSSRLYCLVYKPMQSMYDIYLPTFGWFYRKW